MKDKTFSETPAPAAPGPSPVSPPNIGAPSSMEDSSPDAPAVLTPTPLQVQNYVGAANLRLMVEDSSWGPTKQERLGGFELQGSLDPGEDGLRKLAGKYWTTSGNSEGVEYLHGVDPQYGFTTWDSDLGIPFQIETQMAAYTLMPNPELLSGPNPYFEVEQVIKLKADYKQYEPIDHPQFGAMSFSNKLDLALGRFQTQLEGNQATAANAGKELEDGILELYSEYEYCSFYSTIPHDKKETDGLIFGGFNHVSIEPEYNFYIPRYEEAPLINETFGPNAAGLSSGLSERHLPNLYAMMTEKNNEVSNPHLVDHITLGGALEDSNSYLIDGPGDVSSPTPKFNIKKHSSQYFNAFGLALASVDEAEINPNGNKFKNIVLPMDSVPALEDYAKYKEMFPMFVDIEFSMDKTTEFTNILREAKVLDRFITEVAINATIGQVDAEKTFQEASEAIFVQPDGAIHKSAAVTEKAIKSWNITSWLEQVCMLDLVTGQYKPSGTQEGAINAIKEIMVMDDGSLEAMQTIPPENKFYHSLMGMICVEKIKKLMKKHFRTYGDIMAGRPNYSETVLYRVEKWALNSFWSEGKHGTDTKLLASKSPRSKCRKK